MYEPLRTFLERMGPLPEADWLFLISRASLLRKGKNELLLRPGDKANSNFFILEGVVRMSQRIEGKDVTRNVFTEGDFFGESVSLATGEPTQMTIECVEDVLLIVLPAAHLEAAVRRSHPLSLILLRMMQQVVAFLARRGSDAHRSGRERYAEMLRTRPRLAGRIPQYMVAAYLGLSAEAFSRLRKACAAETKPPA